MNKSTVAVILSSLAALFGIVAGVLQGKLQLDATTLFAAFAAVQPLIALATAKAQASSAVAAHEDEHHPQTAPPSPNPSSGRAFIPEIVALSLILLVIAIGCLTVYQRDPRTESAIDETMQHRVADSVLVEEIGILASEPESPTRTTAINAALTGYRVRNEAELDRLAAERAREALKYGLSAPTATATPEIPK